MRVTLFLAASASAFFNPASAQLRPLEPLDADIIHGQSRLSIHAGLSRLFDQRASIAGTTGDLWEIGNFGIGWRTGRVTLEASGTAQRFFRETSRFAEPFPDVEPSDDGHRNDSGDYRLSTTVSVTPPRWPVNGTVRFGVRLPTTDNTTGLDRDATDFFGTIGVSAMRSRVGITGEVGVGIHTTRDPRFEQEDLFLYAFRADYRGRRIIPAVAIVGQAHGSAHASIRGVENLGEVRLGLRTAGNRWIRAEIVRGWEAFSPAAGVIVTFGVSQ